MIVVAQHSGIFFLMGKSCLTYFLTGAGQAITWQRWKHQKDGLDS